jgi:calcineurin-like phosphoesterase family protein
MDNKTWFTSDLHFGHKNVINYCDRPYANIEEMHEAIVKQWNFQVGPNDTVYVLGDFSLNPKWSREILPKLNGTKILVMGNHDAPFPFPYNKKADKMKQRYLDDGWKDVLLYHELTLSNGLTVGLSHMPYNSEAGGEYDQRYMEFRPEDKGLVLLHGHLHCRYRKNGRMIDVGFDADLKLWSEQEIIDLINNEIEFVPTRLFEMYKQRSLMGDERTRMKGLSGGN